ncbi:MAG: hypothetical protein K1X79_13380 [Oligoflexia bacterium]|nr:hypothetical protein [Oligoflexia bacterium]
MKLSLRAVCSVGFIIQVLGVSWQSFAAPATFADREREQVIGEVYSPLNPSGAVTGIAKDIQMDPALGRVLRPNTFCKGPNGTMLSNCGVSAGNETADWSGGQKKRVLNIVSPNGLRADLLQSAAIGNQFPMLLTSPAVMTATTYAYADAGALAGTVSGVAFVDGAMSGYKMALDSLNAQAQRDPAIGDLAAQKVNGCIEKELNGGSAGNQAQALSICLGDRTMSAGNFAITSGAGATLADIPDHSPTSPVNINGPPSMPGNQHSVWAEIFNPLIYAAPLVSLNPTQATKSDFISLLADARKLSGDVKYVETVAGTGSTLVSIQRERSSNPSDDPSQIFRSIMRTVWNKLNGLMFKMCDYYDGKQNIDPSTHDPFPVNGMAGLNDFWGSIDSSALVSWQVPTQSELTAVSFQSFTFKAVGADLLMAAFLKTQEQNMPVATNSQNPMTGHGRHLRCRELDASPGKPAEFERLLGSSSFSTNKLKEWRQNLAEVTIRVALGQWLGQLRVMLAFVDSVAGGMVGGAELLPSQLAFRMILETAGVESREALEESFRNNRAELRQLFARIESQYAGELARGSGSISQMFDDAKGIGTGESSLTGPGT